MALQKSLGVEEVHGESAPVHARKRDFDNKMLRNGTGQ